MLYNLFENRDFVSVFAVALLAEGVDRNMLHRLDLLFLLGSPSSRRAWIEIGLHPEKHDLPLVALLAEGVDRNQLLVTLLHDLAGVALLAEGVDRNFPATSVEITAPSVALLAEGVDRNRSRAMSMNGS